jgi:hypothetical protein
MSERAILLTLAELDRWKERESELRAELAKVQRQVAYYEALAQDMKREVRPARVSDLLRAFGR